MEDYDGLVPDVDDAGIVDMSHRAWRNLDQTVWRMGIRVMKLDLSFNKLVTLPPQLRELKLVRELNLDHNDLEDLPKALGDLQCLRILRVSHNKLSRFPKEVGNCSMLEELTAHNNSISEFPGTIIGCIGLTVLDLHDNRLTSVPLEFGGVISLKTLDLRGNPGLTEEIPEYVMDRSNICIFILQTRYRFQEDLRKRRTHNLGIEAKLRIMEEKNLRIQDEYDEIMEEYRETQAKFPAHFRKCSACIRRVFPCLFWCCCCC